MGYTSVQIIHTPINIKRNVMLPEKINDQEFTFDLDRMKEAVESPAVVIPQGLTSEEILDFLLGIDTNEKT